MRFKFYLRGIGLGILFSVLLMTIAINIHKSEFLSDDEIIKRAEVLGMEFPEKKQDSNIDDTENTENILGTEINEILPGETISSTQYINADTNDEIENKIDEDKKDEDKKDENNKDTNNIDENNKDQNNSEDIGADSNSDSIDNSLSSGDNGLDIAAGEQDKNDFVIIEIKRGDVCRSISEELMELNVVDDAEAFRKYMGKKGYASKIHTGKFKIPKNASYDEIGKILTKK